MWTQVKKLPTFVVGHDVATLALSGLAGNIGKPFVPCQPVSWKRPFTEANNVCTGFFFSAPEKLRRALAFAI